MNENTTVSNKDQDFSLVLGGPLYQFFLRTRLVKPPIDFLNRRILFFVAVTWLPLLLLTLLSGKVVGGIKVPFLLDLDTHARFLISVPLLLLAERIVHSRLRTTVQQFLDRGIVAEEDRGRFEAIVASNMQLRNSSLIEIFLLGLSYFGGYWLWRDQIALNVATWYASSMNDVMQLTSAGHWYAFVSLPIARFLIVRWYFRLLVWYHFLWQVSRLPFPLKLDPLHPDRAGGLGFLGNSVYAFAPILIAHSTLLAGLTANQIWYEGAKLPDFKLEFAGILGVLLVMVLLPMAFFLPSMSQAKRDCRRQFGQFAIRYTRAFQQKWMDATEPTNEALLGSADIQSLADLGNSYEVVRNMRVLPFNKTHVINLAIMISIPILPLTLIVLPLDQMLEKLVRILL